MKIVIVLLALLSISHCFVKKKMQHRLRHQKRELRVIDKLGTIKTQ